MNTRTNITPAQFNNLNTHGWDLHIDVEGFSASRPTEIGTLEIIVNYRDDGEHYIEVLENGIEVEYCWAPDEGCLQFIEDYTSRYPPETPLHAP